MSIGHLYVLFGEVSIQVLCPFFSWVFYFFGVEYCKFFINFGYQPLIRYISECVPHSVGCLFILLITSFAVQKLFTLMQFYLIIFPVVSLVEKMLLQAMSKILLPIFSPRIFMGSGLTLKLLIYFEFILVCGVRRWSSFIFLLLSVQFS